MKKKNYDKLAQALKDNLQRRKELPKQETNVNDDHNKNSNEQPLE